MVPSPSKKNLETKPENALARADANEMAFYHSNGIAH
jgi:hypothetical protein